LAVVIAEMTTEPQEVRGVARRLATMGITTALQLADIPIATARRQFSGVLERTVRALNGIACLGLEEFAASKEQIVCSRSFGDKPTELSSVSQAARRALERVFIAGHRYHRCGVMLGDFASERVAQFDLFDDEPPRKNTDRLMQLLDSLNQDGRAPVWFAG